MKLFKEQIQKINKCFTLIGELCLGQWCKLNAKAFTLVGLPGLRQRSCQGFTLVEFLVVLAIVAVLAVLIFLVINPLEIIYRSRDARRLADLNQVTRFVYLVTDIKGFSPDISCYSVATPCFGSTADFGNVRKADGSGWIKINIEEAIAVHLLPIDPVNQGEYVYSYASDGEDFELNVRLESETHQDKMSEDGGDNDTVLEMGSDLMLIQ